MSWFAPGFGYSARRATDFPGGYRRRGTKEQSQKSQAQSVNALTDHRRARPPSRLTSDETRVVVVNREANSVSIIRVKDANGNDVATKLVEIGVGEEPRCVASPSHRQGGIRDQRHQRHRLCR